MILFKLLIRGCYLLIGLLILYIGIHLYLNSTYNARLVANLLSQILPARFYIQQFEFKYDLSEIKVMKAFIVAPRGDRVITVENLDISIEPLTFFKDLIFDRKIAVKRIEATHGRVTMRIIGENYINIADSFADRVLMEGMESGLSESLFRHGMLLFPDIDLDSIDQKPEERIELELNNIFVKARYRLIMDQLRVDVGDVEINNGSVVIKDNDLRIRGDVRGKKISLSVAAQTFSADQIDVHAFQLTSRSIRCRDGYLRMGKSFFRFNGIAWLNMLKTLDFIVTGRLDQEQILLFLNNNKIILPEALRVSKDIDISMDLYGTMGYPIAAFNIKADQISYGPYQFKKFGVEGQLEMVASEISLYLKDGYGKGEHLHHLRLHGGFNNLNEINLKEFAFSLNQYSEFTASGDLDLKTGGGGISFQLSRFNPKTALAFLPIKLDPKIKPFLGGLIRIRGRVSGADFFNQKNINSKIDLHYQLPEKTRFGQEGNIALDLNLDQNYLRVRPGSKVVVGNDSIHLWGGGDLQKLYGRIGFNINLFQMERFLTLANIEGIKGGIQFKGNIKGSFFNPELNAKLKLKQFHYFQYKNTEVETDIGLKNGVVQLYGVNIKNSDFSAFLTGKATLFKGRIDQIMAKPEFSIYLRFDKVNIAALSKKPELKIFLNTTIELSGTPEMVEGNISVVTEKFSVFQEDFSQFKLSLDLINEAGNNIARIDKLTLFKQIKDQKNRKKDAQYLTVSGEMDLKSLKFNGLFFIPRMSTHHFKKLIQKKEAIIDGDIIGSGIVSGNLKDLSYQYEMGVRFASFAYPYFITITRQRVIPSKEYGKPDTILYEDVPKRKIFKMGQGMVTVKGDQNGVALTGDLFNYIKVKGQINDLGTKPLATGSLFLDRFPAHRFHTLPLKTFLTLEGRFKYDLTAQTYMDGLDATLFFDQLDFQFGDLRIREATRSIQADNDLCLDRVNGVVVRKNCIEYQKGIIYPDFGFDILNSPINISGKINQRKERFDVNAKGIINLKSFSYFKENISAIDGQAVLSSSLKGTFRQPRYNVGLILTNTSVQPAGYNGEIGINYAVFQLNNNALIVRNLKGEFLGGSFNISGNQQGVVYDFKQKYVNLNVKGYNLNYNVPDTIMFETNVDLKLKGKLDQLNLGGEVKVLDGKFYKSMNIVDQLLLNPLMEKSAVYEEGVNISAIPIVKNISLDLDLMNDGLTISNDLMDEVQVKANIHLGGTLGRPVISGRVSAGNGIVKLLSHRFDLSLLEVNFSESDLLLSTLSFESEAQIQDYMPLTGESYDRNVRLKITGALNDLKIEILGEGLDRLQTMRLLLTGQSGVDTSETFASDDAANKITNQLVGLLLQNAVGKITSDFQDQMNVMIQTNIDTEGNISLSANKMIGKRVMLKGSGQFENNAFQKEVSLEMKIIDQLRLEALQAFEEGKTDLMLKYRLLLE